MPLHNTLQSFNENNLRWRSSSVKDQIFQIKSCWLKKLKYYHRTSVFFTSLAYVRAQTSQNWSHVIFNHLQGKISTYCLLKKCSSILINTSIFQTNSYSSMWFGCTLLLLKEPWCRNDMQLNKSARWSLTNMMKSVKSWFYSSYEFGTSITYYRNVWENAKNPWKIIPFECTIPLPMAIIYTDI